MTQKEHSQRKLKTRLQQIIDGMKNHYAYSVRSGLYSYYSSAELQNIDLY